MYTKQELLELGKRYYKETGEIPAAKKWTKKAGYCSRSWVYYTFGNWPAFLKELGFTENNKERENRFKKEYTKKEKELKIKTKDTEKRKMEEEFKKPEYTLEYWVRKYLSEEIIWPKTPIDKESYISAVSNPIEGLNKQLSYPNIALSGLHRIIYPNKLSSVRPYTYILQFYSRKRCYICEKCKNYSEFYKHKNKSSGYSNRCKLCFSKKDILKIRKKSTAKYKASRIQRIPGWVTEEELEKINKFYDDCPKGYHVDHIIPLNGKHVSGLHVLNNLQYLPSKDNIRKSNSYKIY